MTAEVLPSSKDGAMIQEQTSKLRLPSSSPSPAAATLSSSSNNRRRAARKTTTTAVRKLLVGPKNDRVDNVEIPTTGSSPAGNNRCCSSSSSNEKKKEGRIDTTGIVSPSSVKQQSKSPSSSTSRSGSKKRTETSNTRRGRRGGGLRDSDPNRDPVRGDKAQEGTTTSSSQKDDGNTKNRSSSDSKNRDSSSRRNNHCRNNKQDVNCIVVTESDHERMRKMSLLSFDDPIDSHRHHPSKTKLSPSKPMIEKEENSTLKTECSSPIMTEQSSVSNDEDEPQNNTHDKEERNGGGAVFDIIDAAPDEDDHDDDESSYELLRDVEEQNNGPQHDDDAEDVKERSMTDSRKLFHGSAASDSIELILEPPNDFRQTVSGEFVPPRALQSEESIRFRRTKSMDDKECLVALEFQAAMNASTQTGGFEFAFNNSGALDEMMNGTDNDVPADNDKELIIRRGMKIRGVICPTEKQKHLMRRVSALGMEDPVYGNISEQVNPLHASNIFDDMDFADVPADMQDMLSLVSDKTDIVEKDEEIFESPKQTEKDSKRSSDFVSSSPTRGIPTVPTHSSVSSLPPLGLDPKAFASLKKQIKTEGPPPSPVKSSRKGIPEKQDLRGSTPKKTFQGPYVPPTGSFYQSKKKPGKNRSDGSSFVVSENVLAARVDAMFNASMPVLSTNDLNNSGSSLLNNSFGTMGSNSSGYKQAYKPPGPSSATKNRKGTTERAPPRALPPSANSLFPPSSDDREGKDRKRGTRAPRETRKTTLPKSLRTQNKATSSVYVPPQAI
eukprot:CAMPEP_0113464466 /NCGR_PEP_ID=MMETSP0014_2-20120614/13216_1 /TAXON_ID=2857 /ORGANISM="Nitzschia sp." /LENGTH=779 /DNA_ID=CAMNT_0000356549 /DNA_START=33 /DNA_END=2372 /DNA_ORIENTATION=+ /assembly_acc=CAM_ASM_000159